MISFICCQPVLPRRLHLQQRVGQNTKIKLNAIPYRRVAQFSRTRIQCQAGKDDITEQQNEIKEDKSSIPPLLKKPESVLTLFSISILATTAYFTRTFKKITSQINDRFKFYIESQKLFGRLQSKLRERDFLNSAIQATNTTIDHTNSLVKTQEKRIENAEDLLFKLEERSSSTLEIQQYKDNLNLKLSETETQLIELQNIINNNSKLLNENKQLNLNYTKKLNDLKDQITYLNDRQRLQKELDRKKNLNASSKNATLRAEKVKNEKDEKLNSLKNDISEKLENVEIKKREIQSVLNKIKETNEQLSRKQKETAESGDTLIHNSEDLKQDIDHMKLAISNLNQQQRTLMESIEEKDESERTAERRKKMFESELEKANERLNDVREQISLLQSNHEQQLLENVTESEYVPAITENEKEKEFEVEKILASDEAINFNIASQSQDLSEGKKQAIESKKEKGLDQEKQESPGSKSPSKRPRSRPRKVESKSASTADRDKSEISKPKRGRGRPRKNPLKVDVSTSSASTTDPPPKRKRGRPKKSAVASQTTST